LGNDEFFGIRGFKALDNGIERKLDRLIRGK